MSEYNHVAPQINVTPLIDVLLVLLIIFMVISPLKPSSFKTQVPDAPTNDRAQASPLALVVSVGLDHSLKINNQNDLATVGEPQNVTNELARVFQERTENGAVKFGTNEIEKTVFIKAPRSLSFGEVAKVVDAVKLSGAFPIGLQIDKLE